MTYNLKKSINFVQFISLSAENTRTRMGVDNFFLSE